MKNLKKLLAVVVAIAMITTFMVPSFAAEGSYTYENEAEILYKLGLYKGTSTTTYEPNLGGKLDRQTGVVMLLRLFGQEEEALQMDAADAAAKLAAKFKDAADIADWAQRQVAYAVEKGYVKGLPDGTFAPTADLNGKAFCSLILQQLGYDGDFTYDNAAFDLSKFGGLTEAQAQLFNSNAGINRDSMVGIAFSALQAVYKDSGKTVIEYLAEIGYVDKNLAIEVGVLKKEIKEVGALEDVKVTINETPVLPTEVEVTYVDDTTAKLPVTWPTVNTSEVGEQTIEGSIEGYKDVKATVKVIVQPAELLVDSLEMNNLVEIVVNFNGEVEAGKADEKDNYSVDGKTIKSATISDDKTSVTLLLEDKAEQGEELEVTVKVGTGLETEVTEKVTALDRTLPEAESASLTGPNSFEVVFTEPVQETDDAEISINDGTYGVSESKLSDSGRVLSVTLGVSSLSEGTYKVRVKGYKDYADFSILPKTFDVEYVKDTTAPVATIKSASQNKVEIEFNKAVYRDGFYGEEAALTVDYFYHTYSAWKPNKVETSDNKVYTLKFEGGDDDKVYLLPEGNVTITVLKKVDDAAVVDAWGNEMEDDAKLTATVVADNEAPTVTKVEAEAENKIVVTFDEDVEKADAEDADNYTIKKGGEEVDATISDIDYSSEDKQATIQLDAKLSGGTYTIDIKDIRDSSVSKNRMNAVTLEFEVTDKTAPELVEATYLEDGDNTIIYATFNEEMKTSGDGSVLNKDNYRLGGKALPEGVSLAMFGSDGKKVKITFKTEKLGRSAEGLELIARVADKAGNSVDAWGEGIEDLTKTIVKEDVPKVTEVSLISADKIEIVIDKKLSRYPANGFIVVKDGKEKSLGGISYKYEDGKSIITGTLQSDVKPNDPSDVDGYQLEIVEGKIQSDTGMYLEPGVVEGFKDKYAPSFKDIKGAVVESVYGIAIEFDEDIKIDKALAATDLVVVDRKGNTLVAGKDYTVKLADVTVEDGKVTEVTESETTAAYLFIEFGAEYEVVDGDYKVSTKDDIHYITDANNNIANTFKDKKAKLID